MPEQLKRSMSVDIAGQQDAVHGGSTVTLNDQKQQTVHDSSLVKQAASQTSMNNPQAGSFTDE
jgi:transcription elongation GreA/GreB family factor